VPEIGSAEAMRRVMTGRRGQKQAERSKKRQSIFPIGPRRSWRTPMPISRRILRRLTGNGTIALLVGTVIGAVGGDIAHDWLHPASTGPALVAEAPAPTVATDAAPQPAVTAVAVVPPSEPPPVGETATNTPSTAERTVPADQAASASGAAAAVATATTTPPSTRTETDTVAAMAQPPVEQGASAVETEAGDGGEPPATNGADREDLGPVIAALAPEATIEPGSGSDASAPEIPPADIEPFKPIEPVLPPVVEVPAPGGTPAWLAYAVPAEPVGGRAMIAIVIDDVGLNRPNAERAIALPGPVTLSFMTYADELPRQAAAARAAGHEIMLHVPMEPLDEGVDAGPDVLAIGLAPEEIRRRLVWGLDRMSGYVGINNHMGSRFTQSVDGMAVVMQELRRRGLLFLDSKTINESIGDGLAALYGVPHVDRDVFLDNDMDSGAVDQMLVELERVARERGYAIGIGHPHPGTLDALARWLPTLRARGFELVPISAIVRRVTPPTG